MSAGAPGRRTADVPAAEQPRRRARDRINRLDDRHAELDEHPQAPRERAHGAGERAVLKSRDT